MKATGGYVILKQSIVRKGTNSHTSALKRPVSDHDIDALNAVQATAWRINSAVLDVMLSAWVDGLALPGLSGTAKRAVPDRLADEVWEGMSADDKRAYMRGLAEIHAVNASAEGREQALLDNLEVASELRSQPEIYYPHSRCFRGRIHPMPCVGPHPQGSDVSKALLMFAEGMELGPDGLFWLCVRAGNCGGQDKKPLEERVQWTLDRRDLIVATAADPLGNLWWAGDDVDEPWGLLATIFELAQAFQMDDPDRFVSHLPIPMDGTCNGLQHLSAMGLDPVGAAATNLTAGTERQDIYEEVAKVVRQIVEKDAAAGKPEAMAWHGKISRKTVKRAVMTTPYGVTDQGIRAQLLNDGLVPVDGPDKGPAADYLRDSLVEALGTTVQAARSIMAWLQTVAHSLAKAGLPFDWQTPSGSTVRQAYHASISRRVNTLCGRLRLEEEELEAPLNPKKCALAASPNVIHSFDASHLAMTVVEAHQQGVSSFAMIHDSYGTHAGNTTLLGRILRETFVRIYAENWLEKIRDYVVSYAPHVELPPVPARGTFDLSQVTDAVFFFS